MPTYSAGPNEGLPAEVQVQGLDAARIKTGASIYELGEWLRCVFRSKAYLRYADNWVAFLLARKLPGRTTCSKLMWIVEEYPRETMLAKGIEWCFGRLRFSMLGEQLRNMGLPVDLMYEGIDPDQLNAKQLAEANKRLRALLMEALEDDLDPGVDVKPPAPAPRPPKSDLARKWQKAVRHAGADHAVFGSFLKHGTPYIRIQVPVDQLEIILKPLLS